MSLCCFRLCSDFQFNLIILDTVVNPNKLMNLSVVRPFHLSQAVINAPQNAASSSQLWVKCNEKMALIAILNNSTTQVRLDLAFDDDDVIGFYNKSVGAAADVHLSGYYLDCGDDGDQKTSSMWNTGRDNSRNNQSTSSGYRNPTEMVTPNKNASAFLGAPSTPPFFLSGQNGRQNEANDFEVSKIQCLKNIS